MRDREVKPISILDWILAIIGTITLIGFFVALRYGLGLDVSPADISEEDRIIIYIVIVTFSLLYTLMIENIIKWSKMLILLIGKRLYKRRHVDGFPINESFMGYKFINSKKIILDGIEEIESNNDMDLFEECVWFANMEKRQKSYNRLLRKRRKKYNKRYRWHKKHKNDDKLVLYDRLLEQNRKDIQITNDFLEVINSFDKEESIKYDTYLYELYDITAKEFDAQILLDDEGTGSETWFDKLRASKPYDIITTRVLPLGIGISLIVFGLMYNWSFNEILDSSEKIILNLLFIYLITKVPGTIMKAVDRFPKTILKPALDSAHIFKKYKIFKLRPVKVEPIKIIEPEVIEPIVVEEVEIIEENKEEE